MIRTRRKVTRTRRKMTRERTRKTAKRMPRTTRRRKNRASLPQPKQHRPRYNDLLDTDKYSTSLLCTQQIYVLIDSPRHYCDNKERCQYVLYMRSRFNVQR